MRGKELILNMTSGPFVLLVEVDHLQGSKGYNVQENLFKNLRYINFQIN